MESFCTMAEMLMAGRVALVWTTGKEGAWARFSIKPPKVQVASRLAFREERV
jgi:hypothetical protein